MADALEEMRAVAMSLELPTLDTQIITVKAGLLRLPSGDVTTTVALTIPDNKSDGIFAFVLPAGISFYARTALEVGKHFSAVELNGAIVETDCGNVQFADETWVHAVEFVNVPAMPSLTQDRREIVCEVIRAMDRHEKFLTSTVKGFRKGVHDRCLRLVVHDFGTSTLHVSYGSVLDFAAIQREKLPSLNVLEKLIFTEMPGVSRRVLTDALAATGMRRPRSGQRSTKPTRPRKPRSRLN